MNRIAAHVADPVILRHGTGNGTGDELALVDAAVVGTHRRIGHMDRTVEHLHLGIFHGHLQTGGDHLRGGGEDDIRTILRGLDHHPLRLLGGVGVHVAHRLHLPAHGLLQILPAHLMGHGPGRRGRGALVDEGHLHIIGADDLLQNAAAFLGGRLGTNHGSFLLQSLHIVPHFGKGFFQLIAAHGAQFAVFVHLQPQQQRILRRHIQFLTTLGQERIPEILEIGPESADFRLSPGLSGGDSHRPGQLCIAAGFGKLGHIQPCQFVEFQKFRIGLQPGRIPFLRHHPVDDAGNPGRAEVFQHADPLIALLHIEVAQIFIAYDGFPDALLGQMGHAQADPLVGKLRIRIQHGQKIRIEGRDPSGGLGAHDPLRRNLHQTHVDAGLHRGTGDFRQHLRIGVPAPGNAFFAFGLGQFHCFQIFFQCFGSGYVDHSGKPPRMELHVSSRISYPLSPANARAEQKKRPPIRAAAGVNG